MMIAFLPTENVLADKLLWDCLFEESIEGTFL